MTDGDITYSNPGCHSGDKPFASGIYEGSAADIDIICGFQPSRIVIHNDTDDTEFMWMLGVTAGCVFRYTSAGAKTLETGLVGPIVLAGSGGEGFTVPALATEMNTASDVCYWEAW